MTVAQEHSRLEPATEQSNVDNAKNAVVCGRAGCSRDLQRCVQSATASL